MPKHMRLAIVFFCAFAASLASAGEVPNTLPQAFAALDQQLGSQQQEAFKNTSETEAVAKAHMSLGLYSNCGLDLPAILVKRPGEGSN